MRIRSLSFHSNSKRFCRGFTLTELAIVLGIIGLILGAIWVAAASMSNSNKIQTAEQQTAYIISNYKTLFGSKGMDVADGTDITCNPAAGAINGVSDNFFPPSMIKGACTSGTTTSYPANPWNGYVQVKADGNSPGGIALYMANIPQDACIRYASSFPNSGDIISITVNGTAYSASANALPVSPTTANTTCIAGSGNIVIVDYKAR